MQRFDAAIFDLDGVLADTAEFHYLGWKRRGPGRKNGVKRREFSWRAKPLALPVNEAIAGESEEKLPAILHDKNMPDDGHQCRTEAPGWR